MWMCNTLSESFTIELHRGFLHPLHAVCSPVPPMDLTAQRHANYGRIQLYQWRQSWGGTKRKLEKRSDECGNREEVNCRGWLTPQRRYRRPNEASNTKITTTVDPTILPLWPELLQVAATLHLLLLSLVLFWSLWANDCAQMCQHETTSAVGLCHLINTEQFLM